MAAMVGLTFPELRDVVMVIGLGNGADLVETAVVEWAEERNLGGLRCITLGGP